MEYNSITKNEESLIQYINTYNWDDGFDIPYKILDEEGCSLQVALLMFELADGFTYLETRGAESTFPDWLGFISALYNKILNNEYKIGNCTFRPNLSNVQIYKLKKWLSENEYVFITPVNSCD